MKEVAALGLAAARHLQGEIHEVRADASTRSFSAAVLDRREMESGLVVAFGVREASAKGATT